MSVINMTEYKNAKQAAVCEKQVEQSKKIHQAMQNIEDLINKLRSADYSVTDLCEID